jgi:hypothetical protein
MSPADAMSTPHLESRASGARHRFKLKRRTIHFLRGKMVCACQASGDGALIETRAVQPLHAQVVGKLFRYGRRPLDGELVTIRVDEAAAPAVEVDSGVEVVTLELEPQGAGFAAKKKILLWHGDAAGLGGATWNDIALVNVSASGELPFRLYVTARCGGAEAKLGVLDVLIRDPEGGAWRTARYGLFRTRTPSLKITTPNLAVDGVSVHLDDGEEDTDDEIDVTRLIALAGEISAVDEVAGWIRLDSGVCSGTTNTELGRRRLYQECVDAPPDAGDCALYMYGENRLQLRQGDALIFCAHSFHYLRDGETVPSGRYDPAEVVIEGQTISVVKNSLTLDFTGETSDEGVSRALHALRLRPRSFAGTFNIVEGRSHEALEGTALLALRDQISGFADPALESVSVTQLTELGRGETGFLDRLPEALHGDFVAANHTFTNRDHHWHHFVIHTFPAHRLIESQLFPDRRPPQVALSGVNFDTRKTFIRPEGADDMRRIDELNGEEPARKIAIFGHTDRVGGDAANNQLSLVRARSMNALLRHSAGFWFDRFGRGSEVVGTGIPELKWALKEVGDFSGTIDASDTPEFQTALAAYKTRKGLGGSGATLATRTALAQDVRARIGAVNEALPHEDKWGTREIQHMLRRLGHYAGPINGVNDTATKNAVKAEQAAHGLSQDGDVGLATRTELIRDYMRSLLPSPFGDDRFHPGAVFGCGEAFPKVPTPDNVESVQNRRVEAVFRKSPVTPIDATLLGAAVPYREWLAPELGEGETPGVPNVVVAITDTGFGRAGDNFSGEQLTQPNDLMIKGERWVKPTSVRGLAAGNANAAPVSADGDLRAVADVPGPLTRPFAQMGHGTVCATCMAADGIGTPVGGAPRGPLNSVLGTAPHVKIRPIADPIDLFTMLLTMEVIASDPDVLVFSTSVGFTTGFGAAGGMPPAQIRAMEQRAAEVLMQGKLIVCLAHNHSFAAGFQGLYHTGRTQWGSQGPDRRNPRSTNTGANVHRQRMIVVGNSGRVGTGAAPFNALTGAPGAREDVAARTLIGETVGVQMPGSDIRALLPNAAGMGMSNPTVIAGQNTRIGGATGTSFATPMTAGVAGELLMLDPDLRQPANIARVLEYIEATADPLQNTNPAGGGAAPANPRVNDPIIAGNAAHPAFTNIRRVNYWKAVLATLNKGLSNEGRGANGATDGHFTFCTLRDDSATIWYGFELRSWIPDAVVWFRKPSGELVLAQDAGALFPNDRITGTTWRTTDAFQLAPNQPLPAFPWLAGEFTAAGRQQLFLCQISIEKTKLQKFQSIVLHLPGIDPRDPDGAEGPPVVELRVDNRNALRVPGAAGGAIQAFVTAFDDFVFHVSATPQPFNRFQFFVENNRSGSAVGETLSIRIFAVDAFGNMTRPPAGALTLSHNGTAGTAAPAAGVFINGAAAPQAGTALAFGAGTDPASMARIQFRGETAETVTLSVAGHPGNVAIRVSAAGPVAAFHLDIRRPGAGASVVDTPPRTAEPLELVVRAVDADGRLASRFNGEVALSLVAGLLGSDGPPAKSGVHIKASEPAPFNAAAFRHRFTTSGAAPDNGEHVFRFFNYTPGAVRFKATSGAIEGVSRDVEFRGGAVARFQVDVPSPQTVGNEFGVTVTALDNFGNRIADFEGAVTLATTPGKGSAPVLGPPRTGVHIGNTAFAGDDTHVFSHEEGGDHTFPVTCHTVETVQFQASHTPPAGGAAITGTSRDVAVQAAGALARFRFERRGADRAGMRFELRVIAEDAAGKRLSGFTGNVALTLTRGTAFAAAAPPAPARGVLFETAVGTPGAAHAYVAADEGAFTFFVTPHTAETINIRATSGAITADTGDIVIEGGVFDHFRVAPAPGARRNVPFNVVVTALDQFNNVSPHFLGRVTLNVAQGAGAFTPIPGAVHVFVDGDNSTFTFSVTLTTSGANHIIQATDGNVIQLISPSFNVAP